MTCYRVLMFDPRQGLRWSPIFVGDSLVGVSERAQTAYAQRTILDVVPLHLAATHGWQEIPAP